MRRRRDSENFGDEEWIWLNNGFELNANFSGFLDHFCVYIVF